MSYIPGLNGMRAVAVLLVVIAHRFPQDHFLKILPIDNFGVDIFFVLSGYLISRILFQQLKIIDSSNKTRIEVIKNFILRRMLRIFPIYYLTLFFLYLTKGTIGNNYEENVLWYVFYGANYLIFFEDRWFGALAHLWSLSVEEQFYIVWPFLLYYAFKKRISFLIFLMILLGTVYPFFINGMTKVLTLACINAFGVGALLAYIEIIKTEWKKPFLKTINYLFIPILILILINYTLFKMPYFSGRLAISIITIKIIAYCRYGSLNSFIINVLENKVLYFLGTISYGIYLYHNILPRYWRYSLNKLGIEAPSVYYKFSYLEFILQTLFLILISYLSWVWIEKPLLKLKKYIKY